MRYIHVRNKDANGNILCKGGTTIGYAVDGIKVSYAIAHCSKRDNYNKSVGRAICKGRMEKGAFDTINHPTQERLIETLLSQLEF